MELSSQSASAVAGKPAWSLALGPEETIQYTFRPPQNAVASLGKVLADRKTLYKYLNPHVVGVVTRSSKPGGSQSVYLIDGVTGVVLYHTSVEASGQLLATMAENWLVFAYQAFGPDTADDQTKGQHIVSVELYEGFARNDKTRRYGGDDLLYGLHIRSRLLFLWNIAPIYQAIRQRWSALRRISIHSRCPIVLLPLV